TGAGTLLLTGANTFTGTLDITAGTLSVSADNNLGAAAAGANRLVIDGGALRSTTSMTIASTRGIALGNAGGGGGTFIVNSGTTLATRGRAAAANDHTCHATTVDSYGSVINVPNGTGGTATLSLGALTHTVGGTVVIPTSAPHGTVRTTTTVTKSDGFLGG